MLFLQDQLISEYANHCKDRDSVTEEPCQAPSFSKGHIYTVFLSSFNLRSTRLWFWKFTGANSIVFVVGLTRLAELPAPQPNWNQNGHIKNSPLRRVHQSSTFPRFHEPRPNDQCLRKLQWHRDLRVGLIFRVSGRVYAAAFCLTDTLPASSKRTSSPLYVAKKGTVIFHVFLSLSLSFWTYHQDACNWQRGVFIMNNAPNERERERVAYLLHKLSNVVDLVMNDEPKVVLGVVLGHFVRRINCYHVL